MAKTASLLISSAVVGTKYERDIRARITTLEVLIYFCAANLSKAIYIYSYVCFYDDLKMPTGQQDGSIYGAQSSNKLFDDFIGFYSFKSMAYLPHALRVGLGG